MMTPDDVPCPDCAASAGHPCTTTYDQPHTSRVRAAELRSVEQGTCSGCGKWMVRGIIDGALRVWHPDPHAAANCPPMPDPRRDWNGYATALTSGLTPGEPGPEYFRPHQETT